MVALVPGLKFFIIEYPVASPWDLCRIDILVLLIRTCFESLMAMPFTFCLLSHFRFLRLFPIPLYNLSLKLETFAKKFVRPMIHEKPSYLMRTNVPVQAITNLFNLQMLIRTYLWRQ